VDESTSISVGLSNFLPATIERQMPAIDVWNGNDLAIMKNGIE